MKKLLFFLAFVCAAAPSYGQILLKQSTATTVNGKLTKISDGTDHTGLTVTSITAKIIKQSDTTSSTVTAVTCAASGSANDCVEIAAGMYNMELSASNTDTLGRLDVCFLASGDYTDCTRYQVVNSGYYDFAVTTGPTTAPTNFSSLSIDGSGRVDVIKVAGTTQTAGDIIGDTNDIQTRIPAALGANGNIKADIRDFNGTAGTFASGRPEVNVSHFGGSAGTFSGGRPQVNTSHINGIAATAITTIYPYIGASQPFNFTGTGASAYVQGDTQAWSGTTIPGTDTAGYPKVTIKDGTAQGEISTTAGGIDHVLLADQVDAVGAGGITSTSLAADTITAAKVASDVTTELQTGLYTIQKNVAGQVVPIWMFDSTLGTPSTGLSTAAISCQISKDFAAFATTNDTTEAEVGNGEYQITLTQAESNANVLTIICNATGQKQYQANIYPQH